MKFPARTICARNSVAGRRLTIGALAVMLQLSSACAADSSPMTGSFVLDDVPQLRVVEALRIGSVASPDSGFTSIGAVVLDAAQNVYVAEARAHEIRVFSPAGERVRTIGRDGQGPGEFAGFGGLGIFGDTLWACDGANDRCTLFDLSGNVLATYPAPAVSLQVAPGITATVDRSSLTRNLLIVAGYIRGFVRAGDVSTDSVSVPILAYDTLGRLVDTVRILRRGVAGGQRVSAGGRSFSVPSLNTAEFVNYSDNGAAVILDRTPATAAPASFSIASLGPEQDTIFRHEFVYEPVPVTQEIRDSLVEPTVARLRAGDPGLAAKVEDAIRSAMQLPEFLPPATSVVVSDDGLIWVSRESLRGRSTRWLVLQPDGTPLGRFELPVEATIRRMEDLSVWAAVADDNGVQWLVRYDLTSGQVP